MSKTLSILLIFCLLFGSFAYAEEIKVISEDYYVVSNLFEYYLKVLFKKPFATLEAKCNFGYHSESMQFTECSSTAYIKSGYLNCEWMVTQNASCKYKNPYCVKCVPDTQVCQPKVTCVPSSQPSSCQPGYFWFQDCTDGCGKSWVSGSIPCGESPPKQNCNQQIECSPKSQPSDCSGYWKQICINGCGYYEEKEYKCYNSPSSSSSSSSNGSSSSSSSSFSSGSSSSNISSLSGNILPEDNIASSFITKVKDVLGLGNENEAIIVIILGILLFILLISGGRRREIIVIGGYQR
ncbi:MAG: hypothetical protein QW469_01180 [Candidatus Aenigmatarchaeota archaeon]